jgi:hypothetical protein
MMLGYEQPLPGTELNGEPDIGTLDRRVHEAWKLRQGSYYLEVGKVLPELLADAQLVSQELAGDQQAVAFGLRYELSVFPSGEFLGSPEEAFGVAAGAYLR